MQPPTWILDFLEFFKHRDRSTSILHVLTPNRIGAIEPADNPTLRI
ncbi:hypothetical protein [Microcoleus sp. CAWBG58]|nr:hypothetical protein [Microcoleus sp. CAWBG58]